MSIPYPLQLAESLACDIAAIRARINVLHDKVQLILSTTRKAEDALATTQWFDGAYKPMRDGVYQRRRKRPFMGNDEDTIYWSAFKDCAWHGCWFSVNEAKRNDYLTIHSDPTLYVWRGLNKEAASCAVK